MKKAIAALFAAVLCAVAITTTLPASAGVIDDGLLFGNPGYDYGASVIQIGTTRQYWWCSHDTVAGGGGSDTIKYRTFDTATGVYSPIRIVLAPDPTKATWDRSYICDPTVIRGSFFDPATGLAYTYAMYYTATDRGPGTPYAGGPFDGTNNRIGVAYSNDGIAWTRYAANPVIYPQTYPTNAYGAGQAATYSSDGRSKLTVLYHDDSTSAGAVDYTRTTSDTINFGTPAAVSGRGLNADGTAAPGRNPTSPSTRPADTGTSSPRSTSDRSRPNARPTTPCWPACPPPRSPTAPGNAWSTSTRT